MYILINVAAILLGSLSVFCWLRHDKIKPKSALALAAFLAVTVFVLGLDLRLKTWPTLKISFSAIRGVIGAGFAIIVVRKYSPKDYAKFLRATIVSLPIMYAISKFSCLYVGCCHGFEYAGPLAYVHDGQSYFPVQLLEIIIFGLLSIVFAIIAKKKHKLYIYLPYVALGVKFLLDFCRAERGGPVSFLSWNQVFLLIIMLVWANYACSHKSILHMALIENSNNR